MPNPVQIRVRHGAFLERIARVLNEFTARQANKNPGSVSNWSTGLTALYAKGTGRNACRYLASNQKRRHAERSEARAQALPACTLRGQAGMPVATWQATRNGVMRSEAKQEHRPTGLYSKGTGRNACRYLASNQKRRHAEQSEARAQAGMPVATCHFGILGILGILGIIGIFGIFGIFGIILLPPEFPQGKIGPEGVCGVYEGRRAGGKSFFCKTNPKVPLESTKRWVR